MGFKIVVALFMRDYKKFGKAKHEKVIFNILECNSLGLRLLKLINSLRLKFLLSLLVARIIVIFTIGKRHVFFWLMVLFFEVFFWCVGMVMYIYLFIVSLCLLFLRS